MHRIMQSLHEDHINVSRLLDVIDHVLAEMLAGNPTGLALAHKAMRYMTAYPDIYHHPLEDVVFETLVKRSPDTGTVVAALSAEHRVIGESGRTLLTTLEEINERTAGPETLLELAPEYVARLREHMDTEEGQVFPIAKVVLSGHDWKQLEMKVAAASDPLFGTAVQKSYQDLASALSDAIRPNKTTR